MHDGLTPIISATFVKAETLAVYFCREKDQPYKCATQVKPNSNTVARYIKFSSKNLLNLFCKLFYRTDFEFPEFNF